MVYEYDYERKRPFNHLELIDTRCELDQGGCVYDTVYDELRFIICFGLFAELVWKDDN